MDAEAEAEAGEQAGPSPPPASWRPPRTASNSPDHSSDLQSVSPSAEHLMDAEAGEQVVPPRSPSAVQPGRPVPSPHPPRS